MRILAHIALCAALLPASALAAEECTEIRFATGKSSAEIQGEVPAEGVLCYTMRVGAGHEADIHVLEGSNTIATVIGVPGAEARQNIAFTTQAGQYEIRVGQLMRAVRPQTFRMRVSVE